MLTPPANEKANSQQLYCCMCKREIGRTNRDVPFADLVNLEALDMKDNKWIIAKIFLCIHCIRTMHETFEAKLVKEGRRVLLTPTHFIKKP